MNINLLAKETVLGLEEPEVRGDRDSLTAFGYCSII